jgi:hypothetical protein
MPPGPATAGGLNTHGVFEGDTSMTRCQFFRLGLFSSPTDISHF